MKYFQKEGREGRKGRRERNEEGRKGVTSPYEFERVEETDRHTYSQLEGQIGRNS